jgi:hypothetical protein
MSHMLIAKKSADIMPNVDIEKNIEQGRWDYTNEYNEWEGGDFSIDEEYDQDRMLAKEACVDGFRKDKVANILLERTNWTIHLMMKKRKVVKERIRLTKITDLKLT